MGIIFIVIGISADDIFVFMDAWRQSRKLDPEIVDPNDKERRMAYTFRRASRAMLFTSSTTSVAFIINTFSPIMPLKAFGIFAAVIVVVNFIEATFIFPTALLFYEEYIERCRCSCRKRGAPSQDGGVDATETEPRAPTFQAKFEAYLGRSFNHAVFRLRKVIIFVFLAWTIFAASQSVRLSKLTKKEEFIPEDHPDLRAQKIWLNHFVEKTYFMQPIDVDLIFGVKGVDRSGGSHQERTWDPQYLGEVIWDDAFDVAKPENQVYF